MSSVAKAQLSNVIVQSLSGTPSVVPALVLGKSGAVGATLALLQVTSPTYAEESGTTQWRTPPFPRSSSEVKSGACNAIPKVKLFRVGLRVSHPPNIVSRKSPACPFAFVPRPIKPEVTSEKRLDELATITFEREVQLSP